MSSPTISLSSGFSMPAVGYGTWQSNGEKLETALEDALAAGYRHIDTATAYENEQVIGNVLKKWFDSGRLKREDIFITTKLPMSGNRAEDVTKYIDNSLKKLQVSYVDLYLIHSPIGCFRKEGGVLEPDMTTDHVSIWKEMEKQVDAGKAKYIGISNFNKRQVGRILENSRIRPVANQIELHIYLQQNEFVEYLKKNNIAVIAYSSLGTPGSKATFRNQWGIEFDVPDLLQNPTVVEIAKKNGKTTAQVLLRQILQRDIAVIPKSLNVERIRQNLDITNWSLDDEDMAKMAALNKEARILEFQKFLPWVADHPECPF